MTSVTTKTFPSPPLVIVSILIGTADYTNSFVWDTFAYILSQFSTLSAAGFSGYSYIYPAAPNPYDRDETVAYFRGSFCMHNTQDTAAALAAWEPIRNHINATWPGMWAATDSALTYPSWYGYYYNHYDTSEAGLDQMVGSRLLDGPALTANLTAAAAAWKQFSGGGYSTAYLVSGKGVWDVKPAGGSDSVNPVWRTAYVHANKMLFSHPTNTRVAFRTSVVLEWWKCENLTLTSWLHS